MSPSEAKAWKELMDRIARVAEREETKRDREASKKPKPFKPQTHHGSYEVTKTRKKGSIKVGDVWINPKQENTKGDIIGK